MKLHVYLNFDGNTEEAIYFYQKALKLAEPNILRFGDMPKSDDMPFDYESVKKPSFTFRTYCWGLKYNV